MVVKTKSKWQQTGYTVVRMPKQLKKCYPSNGTDLIRRIMASPILKVIVLQMKQTGKMS